MDHRYPGPVTEGVTVRRYQRFLAEVRTPGGEVLTVHCPNPGSMRTAFAADRPARISESTSPARRLRFTLEQVRMGRCWVGVNTMVANRAIEAAVRRGAIPTLRGYGTVRREVAYGRGGRSRVDLLLEEGPRRCFVEVKNTSLKVGSEGRFPDSVTERGLKHLEDLAGRVGRGDRAVMVYFVHRSDVASFRPAFEIDPAYAEGLGRAVRAGVEVVAVRARLHPSGVTVGGVLPVCLDRPIAEPGPANRARGHVVRV